MLLERVDHLIKKHATSRAELERTLDLSHGSIRNWDKSMPSVDKIQKVADFFDVSVDYLLGRTDRRKYYDSVKENKNVMITELEKLIMDLSDNDNSSFPNNDLNFNKEIHELLLNSLNQSLSLAKIEIKLESNVKEQN